jgi:hypothetical protein
MSALVWPTKDPDEVLDYKLDWTARLDGDTIQTSTWTVPVGITRNSDSKTNTTTTIWLQGGTLGQTYEFVNRITTAGLRTMDQSVKLKIKAK